MRIASYLFGASLLTLTALSLFGCAGDDAAAALSQGEDDAVLSAEQALGETGCWTNACTTANDCAVGPPLSCNTPIAVSSPDALYDTANCVHAFTVQSVSYTTTVYDLTIRPVKTLTQNECQNLYIYARAAGNTIGNILWSNYVNADGTVASYRYKGKWENNACTFLPRTDHQLSGLIVGANTRLRVSARVTTNDIKQRVSIQLAPRYYCI